MLALNGHYWTCKCLLSRSVSGFVSTLCKVNLQTPLNQKARKSAEMSVKLGAANIHSSALLNRDLLMKMINKKKKKRWYESVQPLPTAQSGFLTPVKKKKQEVSQRVRTLNIIVYKAVSDLLASPEVNPDILSYSVEITQVLFTADLTYCRIYWKTTCSADRDSKIQQLLDKCAPRIRYLLMSLQILSNVPPLVFVRDKKYAALQEVEKLLEIADYGQREDSANLHHDGNETEFQSVEALDKKKPLWFDIDHDALHKQIKDYKECSRDTQSASTSSAGLTQDQLDMLAEIRKQKLVEKKKRKSKRLKDYDISPKAFLLSRQLQNEQQEEDDSKEHGFEDSQVLEQMPDYNRKP
ncbi:putative ribosome-binding factor A, mitochondrial [Hoplias malabaricus]|uniref:putative ribosome-binding factor A, mitochondrial n=1 Tax=Hoplias malabaricus TaxID=27720 RepID=UPI003462A816